MDQAQLIETAKQLVVLVSPIIASGALSKVGEDATDCVTSLAKRVWDTFQHRLGGDQDVADDLRRYAQQPTSTARQQIIIEHLATHANDDALLADLQALVAELHEATGTTPTEQRTMTIGDQVQVGVANQGNIGGNLTIGPITIGSLAAPGLPSGGNTPFDDYRTMLRVLLMRLGTAHPRYADALVYEQRLRENLALTEREGDTETRRAERTAVIDQLNQLAGETLGVSFMSLGV